MDNKNENKDIEVNLNLLDEQNNISNETTIQAIEEGRKIINDDSIERYSDIEELKKD